MMAKLGEIGWEPPSPTNQSESYRSDSSSDYAGVEAQYWEKKMLDAAAEFPNGIIEVIGEARPEIGGARCTTK